MEDMAAKAPSEPASCRHPDLGSGDNTQTAEASDQYAARHNPFVYFHSIIDFPTCEANDVDLSRLRPRPAVEATPQLRLHHAEPLPRRPRHALRERRAGRADPANAFLQGWVPRIMRSPAYRDRGLIIVTFDEAETAPTRARAATSSPARTPPRPG